MTTPAHLTATTSHAGPPSKPAIRDGDDETARILPAPGLLSNAPAHRLRRQSAPLDASSVLRRNKQQAKDRTAKKNEQLDGRIRKPDRRKDVSGNQRSLRGSTVAERKRRVLAQAPAVQTNPRLAALAKRRGLPQLSRDDLDAIKSAQPSTPPKTDSDGNAIWSGFRKNLSWHPQVKAAMDAQRNAGVGCQIGKAGCRGTADQIDHVKDFATEGTQVATFEVCDGTNHWIAAYRDDAMKEYNGGNTADTDPPDLSNFQWSCKSCNSKKSGARGNDATPPRFLRHCPDGGDCGYEQRGWPVG